MSFTKVVIPALLVTLLPASFALAETRRPEEVTAIFAAIPPLLDQVAPAADVARVLPPAGRGARPPASPARA